MTPRTTTPTGADLLDAIVDARAEIERCKEEATGRYVQLLDQVADDPDLSYAAVADRLGISKNAIMKMRAGHRSRREGRA